MTLNRKSRGFIVIFGDFGCKTVNCNKMDGDRPRLPANRNCYRLSSVSWALAQIFCFYLYFLSLCFILVSLCIPFCFFVAQWKIGGEFLSTPLTKTPPLFFYWEQAAPTRYRDRSPWCHIALGVDRNCVGKWQFMQGLKPKGMNTDAKCWKWGWGFGAGAATPSPPARGFGATP